MTASMLFAGKEHRQGDYNCYFCGASCDDSNPVNISEKFTNRDIIKYPSSNYACVGCTLANSNGFSQELLMIDGTTKICDTLRSSAPRMYSWLLTTNKRLAFTKAYIAYAREELLNPPNPPFAFIFADSGQKQLIFRAPVAFERDNFSVMLEDNIIDINLDKFKQYMELANSISVNMGKPVLKEPVTMSTMIQAKKLNLVNKIMDWQKVQHEPIAQLAAWLAIPKIKQ